MRLPKIQNNQPQTFFPGISTLENEITPLKVDVEKLTDEATEVEPVMHEVINNDINAIEKEKFIKLRDWRLDDRTINESDIRQEQWLQYQLSFLNTLFIETEEENLDEFLSIRGVPWLVRKLISGKMRKGQFLMKSSSDGDYIYTTGDPANSLQYRFKLNEPFTDIGYDGKKHKITISMDGDRLKEVHENLERDIGEDVFYFYIQNDKLISECEANEKGKSCIWRRTFHKKTQ
ncbi:Fatty acid-binding protein, intestinal [Parelaphostrongylus tenuis]|uniref:Fatty acid-binding protein, intestinal n=1 Tax=Parelaphostrongylus tenuis TaxID=148309 RepID=A0AAD5MT07_PARTN|nr:Fatty acid-binding protein, intestinal [Parelaphostrongylus tenuis]